MAPTPPSYIVRSSSDVGLVVGMRSSLIGLSMVRYRSGSAGSTERRFSLGSSRDTTATTKSIGSMELSAVINPNMDQSKPTLPVTILVTYIAVSPAGWFTDMIVLVGSFRPITGVTVGCVRTLMTSVPRLLYPATVVGSTVCGT